MPVTAKLSKEFYERLGDGVANELVEWLNAVDDARRQEYLELRHEIRQLEGRVGRLMDEKLRGQLGALEGRVDVKLAALKAELLKWMFLFWVGTMGTVLAILKL